MDKQKNVEYKKYSKDVIYELKKQLYRWAKDNLRGKKVVNEQTGNSIEISTQGIDEWYSKSKSEAQIRSILRLTEILAKAIKTHESENIHSDRKNAPSFEYYEYPIELLEKQFNVIVSVKLIIANENGRRIYYHHYLDEKNKPSSTIVRQPASRE